MTDYTDLIDAETWAFIERTASHYPKDATGLGIDEQRAVYDRMCRAFYAGRPEGVSTQDMALAGVPVRVYETGAPAMNVVYFHGGGFVVGGLDSHDDLCAEICAATGARVINVDYRLSPEHRHPAAFDDAMKAVGEVAARWPAAPLVLAGDSAGANLAAAVAHATRGRIALAGQVLIYGAFGGDMNRGSYLVHAHAPMLTRDDIVFYMQVRHGDTDPARDPTALPLCDGDFTGLPPSVVIGAQCDPLADDSRAYAEAINAAGGHALWIEEPGLVHGYLRARHLVARAARSFQRITRAIAALGQGKPFPPDL
ncbi:MAG TPA: esterase [Aliiroseovarius sp.]|nr:esterase [Aliiroseovarius sp.]